jgi:hypothetical protein
MVVVRWPSPLLAVALGIALSASAGAISVGELDNFSMSLEGWTQGHPPGGVDRITTGGPDGAADAFMQVQAGAANPSKLVVYDQGQWAGNYVAASIAAISMDVNNFGATNLQLRLVFGTTLSPNSGGSWLASTTATAVPAASGWQHIQFPIDAASFSVTQGVGATFASVMGSVATMRILHSASLNDQGSAVNALLGIDSIKAVGPPLAGDFDGDGDVDGDDLTRWETHFGSSGSADADADGDSDGNDFLIWQRHVGQTASDATIAAVPEPASAALALIAALAALASPALRSRGRW